MARTATPTTYRFTVSGTGLFPFDMLRFDRCTPAHETDSGAIERTTHPRYRAEQRVTLIGPRRPNVPRWASFGWSVADIAEVR